VNGDVVLEVRLPMHHSDISSLTDQQALSLARQHSDFEALVGSKLVLRHWLVIDTDSLSVDLHLTVDDNRKKKTRTDRRRRVDSRALS